MLQVNVIPKIYRKIKERKLISGNLVKTFKIVDGHLTYKWKRRVMFDNDAKLLIPQYHLGNHFSREYIFTLTPAKLAEMDFYVYGIGSRKNIIFEWKNMAKIARKKVLGRNNVMVQYLLNTSSMV